MNESLKLLFPLATAAARIPSSKLLHSSPVLRRFRSATAPMVRMVGDVSDGPLSNRYDLVVVGGGPGGYAAAKTAAHLGKRTLIIDAPFGNLPQLKSGHDLSFAAPTGLFSKALRDTSKTINVAALLAAGLDRNVIYSQIKTTCLRLAHANATGVVKTLEGLRVDYLQARVAEIAHAPADQLSDGTGDANDSFHRFSLATVCGRQVRSENILIATGSSPLRFPHIPFDSTCAFDADTISQLGFLPESVTITGGGIVGIEFAQIFTKLQAKVTMLVRGSILDDMDRIGLDAGVAQALVQNLKRTGVTLLEGVSATGFDVPVNEMEVISLDSERKLITIELDNGQTIQSAVHLAAIGRVPSAQGLGLKELGVELSPQGAIKVDPMSQATAVPGLYAAGDVVGPPALASTSEAQAQHAVKMMFETVAPAFDSYKTGRYPIGIWTLPEIGYYGLHESGAVEAGIDVETGTAEYSQCLRGRVFSQGEEEYLKLVFERQTGVVVGVQIVGSDACELIHFGKMLVDAEWTIYDVTNQVMTAVTYHELFRDAALDGDFKLKFGAPFQKLIALVMEHINIESPGEVQDIHGAIDARFDEIDIDQDGYITPSEMMEFFAGEGDIHKAEGIRPCAVKNIVRLIGNDFRDGENLVSRSDFVDFCVEAVKRQEQ